ncbi:MAG: SH3 domain-containing protein [Pseudomonadota bacterium]
MKLSHVAGVFGLLLLAAVPGRADVFVTGAQGVGPVTELPLPRYVSLKAARANMRRGPGRSHRIDWILRHRGMPLQVVAEYEHWRRVRDRDGAAGWVHYTLLSGVRTVVITEPDTPLRADPSRFSATVALAEAGVILALGDCLPDWCRVEEAGVEGWVAREDVWGLDPAPAEIAAGG